MIDASAVGPSMRSGSKEGLKNVLRRMCARARGPVGTIKDWRRRRASVLRGYAAWMNEGDGGDARKRMKTIGSSEVHVLQMCRMSSTTSVSNCSKSCKTTRRWTDPALSVYQAHKRAISYAA